MKKNLYYQTLFGRPNRIKMAFMEFFYSLSFWFRIPIEVIIRRNFGERYFSLFASLVTGACLVLFPLFASSRYGNIDTDLLFRSYFTWYVYTAGFFVFVYRRNREVQREPGVFDFKKFSLSTGAIWPGFTERFRKGDKPNYRLIELWVEPAVFFVPGVILTVMLQPIGIFFLISSVIYSLGYLAGYKMGDNFLMDKIDQMISNEEITSMFINGQDAQKGFRFYGDIPNSQTMRDDLYEYIIVQEETIDVEAVVVG